MPRDPDVRRAELHREFAAAVAKVEAAAAPRTRSAQRMQDVLERSGETPEVAAASAEGVRALEPMMRDIVAQARGYGSAPTVAQMRTTFEAVGALIRDHGGFVPSVHAAGVAMRSAIEAWEAEGL